MARVPHEIAFASLFGSTNLAGAIALLLWQCACPHAALAVCALLAVLLALFYRYCCESERTT